MTATGLIDRISGRVSVAIAAAGVLFVVLTGWFVLVAPKRSQAARLQTKTEDAQIQYSETQRFLRSSVGEKSASQLKKLNAAVPSDPRMSEIVRQLTRAARSTGVRVDSITPAAA